MSEKIKIKGRITPYTPQHWSRWINLKEFPDDVVQLRDCIRKKIQSTKKTSYGWIEVGEYIINNRLCQVSAYYGHDGRNKPKTPDEIDFCMVSPKDEPRPPKKPRVTDTMAFNAYREFCKTKNWENLFHAWNNSHRYNFHKKLYELLNNHNGKKDCDNCQHRFQCYTEK